MDHKLPSIPRSAASYQYDGMCDLASCDSKIQIKGCNFFFFFFLINLIRLSYHKNYKYAKKKTKNKTKQITIELGNAAQKGRYK